MANIIVALPNINDAKNLRNILTRNGFRVIAICTNGAQVLNYTIDIADGIVICGKKLPDMNYLTLFDDLPPETLMLVLSSTDIEEDPGGRRSGVSMPLKVRELRETIQEMSDRLDRQRQQRKNKPKKRSEESKKKIDQAKHLLMERHNMTEEEAHRYIQKFSMDSGNNLVETAEMILAIM